MSGVTVRLASSSAPACGTALPAPTGLYPLGTPARADGTFSFLVMSPYGPASYCVRISATRQVATSQDSVFIDGVTLRFGGGDSVRVDLAFP